MDRGQCQDVKVPIFRGDIIGLLNNSSHVDLKLQLKDNRNRIHELHKEIALLELANNAIYRFIEINGDI